VKKSETRTFELNEGIHLIQFAVESRIEPKLITSYWDTQTSLEDRIGSLAEVDIKRITFKGTTIGGAFEC